jgi:hypothetical protein
MLSYSPEFRDKDSNLERVRTDVDARSARRRADDVDPSSNRGEAPLENLGAHGSSFLAAGDV